MSKVQNSIFRAQPAKGQNVIHLLFSYEHPKNGIEDGIHCCQHENFA